MAKIGRNQPCPCGSGKKYKRCHGNLQANTATTHTLPAGFDRALNQKLREWEAERVQREKQQGRGRGILSTEMNGTRMVIVGNNVHYSKQWRTFHDFLRNYIVAKLDAAWFKAEQAKAKEQRHPIVRWYDQATADSRRLGRKVGEVVTAPMTGAQRALLNLAYNLYLIAHHAEPTEVEWLLATFIKKLKSERSDDFIGKLFETYAAAAFLKAGFKLAYVNERNGSDTKVEFVATFPASGKKFSVEVKSRNRAAGEDGVVDDIRRLRVASKLNKALTKKAEHQRVVMIEINVPDVVNSPLLEGWPRAALDQIRYAEKSDAPDGSEKERAYVVVTNHAFHNNLETIGGGTQVLAAGCRIPDFGPDVGFTRFKDFLDCKERHREMFALLESMQTHYDIPATFDGEIPELAFNEDPATPRLRFGQWYLVPGPEGEEVSARLYEAIVIEHEKRVMGVYETLDGKHFMASSPLMDMELAAWKKHPDTFFGEIRQVPRNASNWLELAEVFYETYQNTPREKLLAWLAKTGDIDELRALSQKDLAIIYCERMAWAANKSSNTAA
jgi:hypothetical protein